jgi:deleted-in-malignant-brain-tumors protein 1
MKFNTDITIGFIGATSYSRAAFGQGYGPIYLDNLGCSSAETSLFSCPSNGVGSHNCGHNEDAGARCNGKKHIIKIMCITVLVVI